jgi:hypothetical protein
MTEQLQTAPAHAAPTHEDLQDAVKAAKEAVDASGSRTMHVELKDTEMLGAFGNHVAWDKNGGGITSELRVAGTNQGKTVYEAEAIPPTGLEGSKGNTLVQRRDAQGNIVYEHSSDDPRMARQVGIVAAKSVASVAESMPRKGTSSELSKAA